MEVFGKSIIVTTLKGLEEVLEKELQLLGIKHTEIINRGVIIPYSTRNIYLTNLACRTALRVLVPVETFEANTPEELYRNALKVRWKDYQRVDQTFAIFNAVYSTLFTHSQFASLKVKDALCDAFRKSSGRRPNVDTDHPDIYWHLHINRNNVSISLDSSGTSLHIRGYRRKQYGAPINEVLACGLLALSGWNSDYAPLVDGMTGSGTIAIEAAMMALRHAPNLNRRHFAFKNWMDFDEKTFQDIRQELKQNTRNQIPEIVGVDISPRAIQTALIHAEVAKVKKYIRFIKGDFFDYKPDQSKGTVILNPPYGERLELEDPESLYKEIGSTFKKSFTGWNAGVISNNKEAINALGLNSYETHHLLNGKLECDFKLYRLFEGKKKDQIN